MDLGQLIWEIPWMIQELQLKPVPLGEHLIGVWALLPSLGALQKSFII